MLKQQRELAEKEAEIKSQLQRLKKEEEDLAAFQGPLVEKWKQLNEKAQQIKKKPVHIQNQLDDIESRILEMKRKEKSILEHMKLLAMAIQAAENPKPVSEPFLPQRSYAGRCTSCGFETRGRADYLCGSCRNDAYDYP